jgi:putative ABC transport system permease protein
MMFLDELRTDMRFALRQLRRAPAFTLIATGTLALGIGANSAIFALVDATLMRLLPFPNPEQLVMVWERSPRSVRSGVAPLNMRDWNEQSRTFPAAGGLLARCRRHGDGRRRRLCSADIRRGAHACQWRQRSKAPPTCHLVPGAAIIDRHR